MDPWIEAMRRGDFAYAWRISDRVLNERMRSGVVCYDRPRHLQFIWRGEQLEVSWRGEELEGKRLFVRCYHGMGVTLQFVRLLALPRLRAAEITLWAQPKLLKVLQTVRGIDRLLPLHDGEPDVDYDVDIELMELPHALRIEMADLPGPMPYIYVPAPAAAKSHNRRIGVCWSAGDWRLERSIPSELLSTLAGVPNVRWFSLQYPPAPCPL